MDWGIKEGSLVVGLKDKRLGPVERIGKTFQLGRVKAKTGSS